jgi:hypothetical protein
MRFLFAFYFCSLALLAGCVSQKSSEREPSAVKPPQQALAEKRGYTLEEKNSEFLRFSFKDQGDFIVSTKGYRSRPLAEGFCSVREGYTLSDLSLPQLMMKSSVPIEELRKQNAVSQKVLNRGRSGFLFWVKGSTVDEEASISGRFDNVLELYEDCRLDCLKIGRLSLINSRISDRRGKPREPLAICISQRLKQQLSKQ